MSSLPPDPSFPDSRRLRLEAEAAKAVEAVEVLVEKVVAPTKKPVAKAAPKRSHKKRTP